MKRSAWSLNSNPIGNEPFLSGFILAPENEKESFDLQDVIQDSGIFPGLHFNEHGVDAIFTEWGTPLRWNGDGMTRVPAMEAGTGRPLKLYFWVVESADDRKHQVSLWSSRPQVETSHVWSGCIPIDPPPLPPGCHFQMQQIQRNVELAIKKHREDCQALPGWMHVNQFGWKHFNQHVNRDEASESSRTNNPIGYIYSISICTSDADICNCGLQMFFADRAFTSANIVETISAYERINASTMASIMKSAFFLFIRAPREKYRFTNSADFPLEVPHEYFHGFTPIAESFEQLDDLYFAERKQLPGYRGIGNLYGVIDHYYQTHPEDFV